VRILVLLLLGMLPFGAALAAEPQASSDLAEVLVVGKRPGPGMWKVSRGDHVLWLLGTPELLPARMEWESAAVEAVMAQSQARISGPRVSIKGGPITLFRLYRQWRRMQQTDEHAPLGTTLPAALHGRFEALRQRYAPRETDWEKLRPMLAADKLFATAVEKSGLKRARSVDAAVDKLADKHRVKVQRVQLTIDEPEQLLRELAETPEAAEVHCMESTVARVETDMDASARRAAAWARGDIREIRSLSYPDSRTECAEAVAASTPRVRALMAQSQAAWLQAVDAALVGNASTVATRPIQDLLRADGVLSKLEARGYRVEWP
jgi:uncharacterized protein YbaP (TraB family)